MYANAATEKTQPIEKCTNLHIYNSNKNNLTVETVYVVETLHDNINVKVEPTNIEENLHEFL